MLKLSCLCGQVHVEVSKRPDFINECNCMFCSKSGAWWGYFAPSDVKLDGATQAYRRGDKAEPAAELHFCPTCGTTTHFVLTESTISKFGNTMMGLNMRLVEASELAGIELRYPDGRAWHGEGAFGHVRGPRIIGE